MVFLTGIIGRVGAYYRGTPAKVPWAVPLGWVKVGVSDEGCPGGTLLCGKSKGRIRLTTGRLVEFTDG